MKFVNPMTDTPEGKLLAIVRDIEKAVGIEKNSTYGNYSCENCDNLSRTCKDPKCEKNRAVQKYVQESSGDNVKPMFMEISGKTEIPAAGYQGNQILPYTEDASAPKAINEVFKMPSVAQTGYDQGSSSLHMHYNDGGDSDYRAKIEESLAEIKKQVTVGQQGVVEEIAGLIEGIYARL